MRILARIGGVVAAVAYPAFVFLALRNDWSPRAFGLLALGVVVPLGVWRVRRLPAADRGRLLRVPAVLAVLFALSAWLDDARFLLAMPVVISLALLVVFAASLRGPGPSTVESFARLVEPELDAAKVAHCRQATIAWCAFFVVNAAIAGALAVAGSHAAWALYTGAIAYALMGLMFAAEMIVRGLRFGRDAVRFGPPADATASSSRASAAPHSGERASEEAVG